MAIFMIVLFSLPIQSIMAQTTINLPQACDCPATTSPSTNGTAIVSAYGGTGCTGSGVINGSMTQGVAVSGVTMSLYANVTQLGTWSLTSTTNGVTFTGSGTFTALSCQLITLTASGTPTASGSFTWSTNSTPAGSGTATVGMQAGTITSLNCAGAINTGTLTGGVAASGVSSSVPYTGGNGGTYSAFTVSSTGVTGLTATIAAGTFASGAGNLTVTITGTPAIAGGTASFALNIGGRTCTLTRTVAAGAGTIASLNCAGATNTGTLTGGVAASGVSSSVPYTGGNGGTYSAFSVASTGVTGLTASIAAGTFASGAGSLTVTITGTPVISGGTASFALNIGGQTCTLTRTVSNGLTNPTGAGSFAGRLCFDIAESNDNTNGCGLLSGRIAQRANFNLASTNTQTYTFTPLTAVSNVRFYYANTNEQVIMSISGGNSGNNITTGVSATVVYNTALSSPNPDSPTSALPLGTTSSNPVTAEIYVVYNNSANNTGTDMQLKLIPQIKDCACCGANVAAGVWKEFLCHNLGANTSLDPHDMAQTEAWGLNGAYIQWGKRGPNTTGDSRVDWVTAPNDGPGGFAAAPTGSTLSEANSDVISGWSQIAVTDNNSWMTAGGVKTANDPCPAGYRVPTRDEWVGVNANNTISRSGTWDPSYTNYSSALHYGPNASTKLLSLPATSVRGAGNGVLGASHGQYGYYWSSTVITTYPEMLSFAYNGLYVTPSSSPLVGYNIRCIAE